MIVQGQVSNLPSQSFPDNGNPASLLLGKMGELVVAELHGKYFTQNYRGNLYHYGTPAAGVTLTTVGSTTQTFGIGNPQGSGKLIVPTKCRITQVGATGTVTAFGWTYGTKLGAFAAAGTSNITALTTVTALSGNTGIGSTAGASNVGVVFSTITLGTAPTLVRWTGFGWGAPLATTATDYGTFVDDFDGDFLIAPGTGLFLGGSGAPGAATVVSLSWVEIPV